MYPTEAVTVAEVRYTVIMVAITMVRSSVELPYLHAPYRVAGISTLLFNPQLLELCRPWQSSAAVSAGQGHHAGIPIPGER